MGLDEEPSTEALKKASVRANAQRYTILFFYKHTETMYLSTHK